jgi:hypothetical protein
VIAGIIHESPPFGVGFSICYHPLSLQSLLASRLPYGFREIQLTAASPMEYRRAGWFTLLLVLINLVGDGWSGRPTEFAHQLILLPVLMLFLLGMRGFLFGEKESGLALWSPTRAMWLVFAFELVAVSLFFYECHHFAHVGYRFHPFAIAVVFGVMLLLLGSVAIGRVSSGDRIFGISLSCYLGGMILAIASFPLTYLRSDMLPVILWADTNLLHHVSPYSTMYVGQRVYDFPYLPGMLVTYLPFVAAHLDIRLGAMIFVVASAVLIFRMACNDRRVEVATLLALFLLCPFLQYRHELYLPPHWLAMVLGFVLMQRRHFAWAAVMIGVGMAIYQFSWIMFPFFVLNALRRRGWVEAIKLTILSAVGALIIAGPFLRSAANRIASNTVGQWANATHAGAEPLNFSYWVTYVIHPDKLLRLQAVLMIAIFVYCFVRNRCVDLTDTIRWMIIALTLFILLNVLVDGYFYLMLLVPMLVYTCVANGWWRDPEAEINA